MNPIYRLSVCFVAIFLGQLSATENLEPLRLDHQQANIKIDGMLDEPAWQRVQGFDRLLVVSPDTLVAPSYATDIKVFYTDVGLYLGVRSEMPVDERLKRLSTRDANLDRDGLLIIVDPSGSGLYGHLFMVNLGGALTDGQVAPPRDISLDWDGAWYGASSESDDAWFAEMLVPWAVFAMPDAPQGRNIGLYVERKMGAKQERWGFPAIPRTRPQFLSVLQPLAISGVNPGTQLSLYPFASTTIDRVNKSSTYKTGLDAYWRPSADILLSATVNPDFGQVESDKAVVNLSAFETFFEEQRPFFLEGQEVFESGEVNLVNTRRIGAGPYSPELADDEFISAADDATELDGAVKLAGQQGNLRYGLLGAFENDAEVVISDELGNLTDRQVAGRDFAIVRALYEDSGDSYRALGVLSTNVLHEFGDKLIQAVDAAYRSADGVWNWRAQAIRSDVESFTDREIGQGLWTDLKYTPRQGQVHKWLFNWYDDKLQLNDLGFLRRNDFHALRYTYDGNDSSNKSYKNIKTKGFILHAYNEDGKVINSGVNGSREWQFLDNQKFKLFADYSPARWDDRNSLGNGDFRVKDRFRVEVKWSSDAAKVWSGSLRLATSHESLQGISQTVEASLRYIPNANVDIKFGLKHRDRNGWLVHQGEGLFTTFKATQWEPNLDASWFLTPQQQLKFSLQWIGVRAKGVQRYGIAESGHLQRTATDAREDDFSLTDMVVQLRYKWELAPLSDLFVVYTRGGSDSFGDRKDSNSALFKNLYNDPDKEQLIVKLRYRFGS